MARKPGLPIEQQREMLVRLAARRLAPEQAAYELRIGVTTLHRWLKFHGGRVESDRSRYIVMPELPCDVLENPLGNHH